MVHHLTTAQDSPISDFLAEVFKWLKSEKKQLMMERIKWNFEERLLFEISLSITNDELYIAEIPRRVSHFRERVKQLC